jgi:hypothetical protein
MDFEVPILKQLRIDDAWKSPQAMVAMSAVGKHMDTMECYACHADWVPQCYGCHITVDYSKDKTDIDWIKTANARNPDGLSADYDLGTNGIRSEGKVSETRSYLRWETPILGINGEGRVSPLMPGCQIITTVIDKEGNTVADNQIWMTPEGKGFDHAAVQPHTTGREARSCESCHNNPKTLGYGIENGRFLRGYEEDLIVDLETYLGETIPDQFKVQSPKIPGLDHDLSQIVNRDGEQLGSVGSHWPLTGPLPASMRKEMERTGLCMGCHKNMLDEILWNKVSSPGFVDNQQHRGVMDKLIKFYARQQK